MLELDKTARKPNSDYVYGVDLVRFACAVGVGAYHLTLQMPEIAWSMSFGWVGVEIFFVISGLVIANSSQGATARQFVTSRFLRLYPAAWCAAIVSYPFFLWTVGKNGRKVLPLIMSVTLLHGPFIATAYWTLPIELSFYFVVFLIIKSHGFGHIQLVSVVLILWSAPYLFLLMLYTEGIIHWAWVDFSFGAGNMSLLRHGLFFGLGILIWLFKEKRLGTIGFIAAGVGIILAYMEIYARGVELFRNFERSASPPQPFWNHLSLSANIAFSAGFAAILLSVKFNHLFPMNKVVRRIVRQLGLMTYPFYLLHQRVGGYVTYQLSRVGVARLPGVMVALICTGIISLIIASYFEPALRGFLRQKVRVLSPAPKERVSQTT